MIKSSFLALILTAMSLGFVSCSQDSLVRIHERPLITNPTVNPTVPATQGTAPTPSLLEQLGNTNTIGSTNPAITPPTTPLPGVGTTTPAPTKPGISGLENLVSPPIITDPTVPNPAIAAPKPAAVNLPVASPVPGDRTVVFSPYSPGKKVSIKRPDGTPYPSGSKMRDPYSPGGQGMFRIP